MVPLPSNQYYFTKYYIRQYVEYGNELLFKYNKKVQTQTYVDLDL